MKAHTNNFKEQIKLMGKEIDSKITFGDTVLGKSELNAVTPSYQGAILKSVMKQLDIDSNIYIPVGTILKYEFGVKVNGEYEYVNFGNYVVKDVEKQEDTNSYKITCYDKMLLSMKDYVKIPITYPITISEYINSLCAFLGLNFANKNDIFANYDKVIQNELYLDSEGNSLGYTFRDVFDELAQVTASTICINKNDEVEIRYIKDVLELNNIQGFSEIIIEDAMKYNVQKLSIDGNSYQETRDGKNLLPFANQDFTIKGVRFYAIDGDLYLDGTSTGDISSISKEYKDNFSFMLPAGTYHFERGTGASTPTDSQIATYIRKYDDNDILITNNGTFTLTEKTTLYIGFYSFMNQVFNNRKMNAQLEQGDTATEYETCGVSPSPDYPSEIETLNSVEVKISGNLVDLTPLTEDKIIHTQNITTSEFIYDETLNKQVYHIAKTTSDTYSATTFKLPVSRLNQQNKNLAIIYRYKTVGVTGKNSGQGAWIGFNGRNYWEIVGLNSTEYVKNMFIEPSDEWTIGSMRISKDNPEYEKYSGSYSRMSVCLGSNSKDMEIFVSDIMVVEITDEEYNADVYIPSHFQPYKEPITATFDLQGNFVGKVNDIKDRLYIENGNLFLEKKIGKVVFNGSEIWSADGNKGTNFRHAIDLSKNTNIPTPKYSSSNYSSTHFIATYIGNNSNEIGLFYVSNLFVVFTDMNQVFTAETWKQFLSENNVTVYYELAEPYVVDLGKITISLHEGYNRIELLSNLETEISLEYATNFETINEEYLKDVNVNFGEKYGKINSIVLSRSGQSDNVYLQDETSVAENGLTELKIIDNQIMNFNDRSDYLHDILEKLNGLEYYLNDFTSTGICYLDLCDKYNIKIGDINYPCVMFNDEILVTQGLQENVYTEMPEETETDYTKADKTDRKINQTYLIVDKQNGVIESVVNQTTEQGEKISKVTQTVDEISSTVSNEIDSQNEKISKVTQTVEELNSKIGDIADITISAEDNDAQVELDNINQSEPIRIVIRPIEENISYLYPHKNLFPSDILYLKNRKIRFTNIKTEEIFDYELPTDLLYYDSENYDEFILDYDGQSCVVNKRVNYNEDGTTYILENPKTLEFEYPRILLTDGDYQINILGYDKAYLFVRLMAQNIYTTQFATRAEVTSEISQTAQEINLEVSKKVNETEVVSTINQSAEQITLSSNRLVVNSDNFKLDAEGNMTCNDATLRNATFVNGAINITQEQGQTTLPILLNQTSNGITYNCRIGSGGIQFLKNGNYMARLLGGNANGGSLSIYNASNSRVAYLWGTEATQGGYFRLYDSAGTDNIYMSGPLGSIRCITLNQTSRKESKKNFEKFDGALNIINDIDLYKYNLKVEEDNSKKHIGFVIGKGYKYSSEITATDENGKEIGVDLYSMTSLCLQAIKEQQEIINQLKEEIKLLKESEK